jgi:quercetin dioxygenase-like cupin family protein
MKRTPWALALLTSVAVAMISCTQAEAPEAAQQAATPPPAQTGPDPTVVDAAHYTVDQENDRMRVIRIKYGPGEESVMHYHPAGMAVFLTDAHGSFELPDGTTQPIDAKAGQVMLLPAGQHKPSNLGKQGFEVVQVELKD